MEKEEYDTIFGSFSNDNGNPKLSKFKYDCRICDVTWRSHKPNSKCWVCKDPKTIPYYGLV